MKSSQRHAAIRVATILTAVVVSLALPALAAASDSATAQYRSGVAAAAGDSPTSHPGTGAAQPGGFGADAEASAAATAPDFNVARTDTDGGGRGGLVFLIAIGAAALVAIGLLAVRRRARSGAPAFPTTATPGPHQG